MTFAPEHDAPIPYMQRTRDYYQALGFAAYRWAHFADVPFTPLSMPLAQARLALITTAAPFQPGVGDQGPGAKYNAAGKSAELSKIFDWYKDDFKADGGAIAFINKRRSTPIPADAKISYQDYDWGLNEAK